MEDEMILSDIKEDTESTIDSIEMKIQLMVNNVEDCISSTEDEYIVELLKSQLEMIDDLKEDIGDLKRRLWWYD